MTPRYRLTLVPVWGLLILLISVAHAAEFTQARIAVYFSPNGGATEAVVHELNTAKTQVLLQAYGFPQCPLPKPC